ncbi:MAG: PAS domain S-box protein, partial [Comamonadaceae bacterium]
MRSNLPVTQKEYALPEGEALVSTTDLDSRITYCNASFIRVSGYERDELLGQPHNLIRHPDMPAEAFRDMWATLRSGLPWSQLVKNRRKDGDHYWVVANVTPLLEAGRPVGYMSVRTRATRQQIDAAEQLYATMRAEAAAGRPVHVLRAGEVTRTGALGALGRWSRPGLTARMALALVAVAGASAALAAAAGADRGWLAAGALGGQALVVAAAALWLRASVTRPIVASIQRANRMAAGELHSVERGRRHDELGGLNGALAQLTVNLQAMVGDVRLEAGQIDGAADEIATAGSDLSARTESQAGSLQETAAAVEQIASTVQRNAGNATEASRQAGRAGEIALRG